MKYLIVHHRCAHLRCRDFGGGLVRQEVTGGRVVLPRLFVVRRKGLDHDWTVLRLFHGPHVQEVDRRRAAGGEPNLNPDVRHVVTSGQCGLGMFPTSTHRLGLDHAEHNIRGHLHLAAPWVVLHHGQSGRRQVYLVHDIVGLVDLVLLVHEGFVDAHCLQMPAHHGLTAAFVQNPSSIETEGGRHVVLMSTEVEPTGSSGGSAKVGTTTESVGTPANSG
mmetsp:Transcript_11881/g.19809  ORF Transcript_11881/g.19809 Transcript_11881/m.19809 type:complete len:219 (+) Transcript_11881:186-842(+)